MDRVHIKKLKLAEFRNHCDTVLELDHRHIALTGKNGAGKTNILEALSFLSPGRGLRRASHDQIGNINSNGSWAVFAHLEGPNGEVKIGTGLQQSDYGTNTQRRLHIDGESAKISDVLLEYCRVLWLTPAMDGLFSGPASDRRRFLDRLVLALDPAHGRHVANYEKAMRSRNRLLGEQMCDSAWLDAIEAQLSELGVAIAAARQELIALLSAAIAKNHDPTSPFPDAVASIDGSLELAIGDCSATDLEAEYAARLRTSRSTDIRAGRTLEGPHRSDLIIHHKVKSMPAKLCSTGEQKALLIGLVLAHTALVSETTGLNPILLLDEIAAHLDEGRRIALYDLIERLDCQAWMTGTDSSLFTALGIRARHFSVDEGKIEEYLL